MTRKPDGPLRRGWTTGACATAAVRSALTALWGAGFEDPVSIALPKGELPVFPLAHHLTGSGWAEAGIIKDAGDDPDVTHGALVIARVSKGATGSGVVFKAGLGVGIVTKPGLPIGVGEAAINPVPRAMMTAQVIELAAKYGVLADVVIVISIPGGAEIALKTWNPRLGIVGGLSILGTTGIVRPYSCAAWIASIHRGIDVARATGVAHVAGCTGATSESAVQALYGLPDHAMLDMGDFVGGMLKYLKKHPVERVTIGGGLGKITKLAQGAVDLHSARSQVDFAALAQLAGDPLIAKANTALEAFEIAGENLVNLLARMANENVRKQLGTAEIATDIVIIDRAGKIIGRSA